MKTGEIVDYPEVVEDDEAVEDDEVVEEDEAVEDDEVVEEDEVVEKDEVVKSVSNNLKLKSWMMEAVKAAKVVKDDKILKERRPWGRGGQEGIFTF